MGTPMRIAQLCADRGIAPGSTKGAAQHLRGIASGLSDLGEDVTTYSARRAEAPFPVEVRDITSFDTTEAAKADVVYERYSLGHRRGLEIAQSAGRPFVLEVNAPLVAEAGAHRPATVSDDAAQVESELLAEADLVITVSQSLGRWAGQFRSGPTLTLTNGFEPQWFTQPNRTNPIHDLVFIGHPKPWHGADRLPLVLHDLAQRGIDATLLVIGGGNGAEALLAAARELDVDHQITVTGVLSPELATSLLAGAAIGIAPYPLHQNFYFCPLKIIDYLAAGLPIVSTAQGDIADLVGDAGIVVAPGDVPALSNAVEQLLTNRDLRERLGDNGRRRAFNTMTWKHVAERTRNALRELDVRQFEQRAASAPA